MIQSPEQNPSLEHTFANQVLCQAHKMQLIKPVINESRLLETEHIKYPNGRRACDCMSNFLSSRKNGQQI